MTNLVFDFWDSDSNQIRANLFQNRLKIRWDSNPKFRDSSHHYTGRKALTKTAHIKTSLHVDFVGCLPGKLE